MTRAAHLHRATLQADLELRLRAMAWHRVHGDRATRLRVVRSALRLRRELRAR